jgi:aspartate/methionine/tyrosine aminotransferase
MAERTIGLMGFTKTFSMGGWRIGFLYGPQPVVEAGVVFQQHLMTCAGSFAQAGAAFALEGQCPPEIQDLWQDWERRCAFVAAAVNEIPRLSCRMPEGAFYAWIDIRRTGEASEAFCQRLLQEQQVALVPGSAFGPSGEGYVRMTCVRSWPDLRDGVARIARAVA